MELATPNREEHRGEATERRDAGVSLIEIVISIVLMGTVVVAILNATSSSIRMLLRRSAWSTWSVPGHRRRRPA